MTEKMKPSVIAWIGDIPTQWETKRIKYVISDIKDGTHGTFDRVESGELLLSAKNVFDDGIHIGNNESEISYSDYASIVANGFPRRNDVLLCCVGTIGRCCVYEFEKPLAFQRSVSFLRPLEDTVPVFLKYALQSDSTVVQEQLLLNKSAQEGLYMGSVRELVIALPDTATEQQAIADFLDTQCTKIDSVIADIEKQIETLQKYKKSLITEAVTKGLDRSVPMKNSGMKNVDDIPQGWSVQRLKYVSRLKTGTTPAGNEGINYEGQGIPWFTPSDFVPSLELEKSEKFVDDETINREGITPYPANSVLLVAIGATVGKIGITKSKGYSNQQITAIIPTGIDSKYLLYYLFSKADYIKDNALYTTLPIINNAYLSNIPVIIPSEQEQKDIAEYLDRRCSLISKIICDKEKQQKIVQQHKKSLIYEYVTGKKRVTEVN